MGWARTAAVALSVLWIGALLLPCAGAFMGASEAERSAEAARSQIDRLAAGEVICGPAPSAAEAKADRYASVIHEMRCTTDGLKASAASDDASALRQRLVSALFFAIAVAPPAALWLVARAFCRSAWWTSRQRRAHFPSPAITRATIAGAGAWAVVVIAAGVFMDDAHHGLADEDLAFLAKLYIVPLVAAGAIALLASWARLPLVPARTPGAARAAGPAARPPQQ